MKIKDRLKGKTRARLVYNASTLEILNTFKEWRDDNPTISLKQADLKTVEVGVYSLYDNYKKEREKLGLVELHEQMIKTDADNYKKRYDKAQPTAKARLDAMEKSLKALELRHECSVEYHIDGDTHGIDEEYLYISTTVDGIDFERRIES